MVSVKTGTIGALVLLGAMLVMPATGAAAHSPGEGQAQAMAQPMAPPAGPVAGAGYYVEEKMLVKAGKEQFFVDYWLTKVLPVFAAMPGYMGYTISTTHGDPQAAAGDENFGPLLPLGPPDEVFIEHGGIQLRGVTTNTMIHFDSLLRGTYNFKVVHYWKDAASLRGLLPLFGPNWTRINGDTDPWGTLERDYFANLENHWDTVFRVVSTDDARMTSERGK
jgi:hypothetical protein